MLAGCATAPTVDGADRQVEVDSHLLLGDIALERQDSHHGRARVPRRRDAVRRARARPSARRAWRTSSSSRSKDSPPAARWRELAPSDERPAWYLGVFETRANRVPRAIAEFETFMRSIDDRRTGLCARARSARRRAVHRHRDSDHARR